MNTRAQVVTSILIGLGVHFRASATDDPGKDFGIQLFLNACVTSHAHASGVEAGALKMGLTELKGQAADEYLSGRPGRAWHATISEGAFAVSLLTNGLCSVFIHQGDAQRIRSSFESWLPPLQSGIKVTPTVMPTPAGLSTTSYELRGGKVNETWVITLATRPEMRLRAIMSYEGR
jgi:hypothetical protein